MGVLSLNSHLKVLNPSRMFFSRKKRIWWRKFNFSLTIALGMMIMEYHTCLDYFYMENQDVAKLQLSKLLLRWHKGTDSLSGVFINDRFQRLLTKGSKIFHWTANHFFVWFFPWARALMNVLVQMISPIRHKPFWYLVSSKMPTINHFFIWILQHFQQLQFFSFMNWK